MDPSFDRGEIDRASLDATERLRARLSGRPITPAPAPARSVLPWVIAGSLFVFTAGMIANPWFERSVRGRLPFSAAPAVPTNAVPAATTPAPVVPVAVVPAEALVARERLARTEAQVETSTELLRRDGERIDRMTAEIAGLAARLDAEAGRTEAASATAIAAADRAQGMIVVLLVRNALSAGRPLGGIEPVLRQSFEARYPQAVTAVVVLGTAPVTLDGLRRDFARLSPAATGTRIDWWQSLAVAVRSAVSRPGDAAQTAQEAGAAALARGDVAAAAAQLRRIAPRSPALAAWLGAADRWQAGMAALTTLETAAIMPPVVAAPPAAGADGPRPLASGLNN